MLCQVCEKKTFPILDLGKHPLCDDLIPINSKRISNNYNIEIQYCDNCFTAFQKFNLDKTVLFPKTYHYRSRMTGDVLKGMKDLIDSLKFDKKNAITLLDIGSNDGSLLDIAAKKGFNTIGIEPTDAYKDSIGKSHIIYNDYFDHDIASRIKEEHGFPSFITFTNVFAHIDNLNSLIEALSILLGPNTTVVIENHYLGSVIKRNQFDTFYHEHPRTYSLHSFKKISSRLGLNLSHVSYPSRYGGNIRVHMSNQPPCDNLEILLESDKKDCINIFSLQNNVAKWIASKKPLISSLSKKFGPLPSKAFPGRAAILYKLLNLDHHHISCAYEKDDSQKNGHFIPGTLIPIKPESELFKKDINPNMPIINNAWHISSEIRHYLNAKGINNPIIDILENSDFD